MTTTFNGGLIVSLAGILQKALNIGAPTYPVNYKQNFNIATGTGADDCDTIWADNRTLSASSSETLALTGSLTDAFGGTVNFTAIRGIMIFANAANTNNVIVGGAASNAFNTWVGASTHTITIRPGGLALLYARDTTGYAVTASTADQLKIANSSSGTSVNYDILLFGVE